MNTAATNKNNNVVAIDNYSSNKRELQKDFTIDLADCRCGNYGEIKEYYTDDEGSFVVKTDKKGQPYTQRVAVAAVRILRILDASTSAYIQIGITIAKHEKIVSAPLSALTNLSKSSDELRAYADAGGALDKKFGSLLYDVILSAARKDKISREVGFELCGWNDGVHVRPDDEHAGRYVGNLPRAVERAGTFDGWRLPINDFIADQPKAQLLLSFAAGSYLRGLSGFTVDNSNIINLYSFESSTGKTSMLQILQSMQQSAIGEGKIKDGSTTLARSEDYLTANNHGFWCLDELHSLLSKERSPVERLMLIGNGGGRGKKTKNGGVADERTWNSTVFFSGNTSIDSITQSHPQREAMLARTIEFDCSKLSGNRVFCGDDVAQKISALNSALAENYGTAYEQIINIINDDVSREELQNHFSSFLKTAFTVAGADAAGTYARKAKAYALAVCGAVILQKIGVSVDAAAVNEQLASMIMSELGNIVQEKTQADLRVRDDLLSIFHTLKPAVSINGYLAKSDDDLVDTAAGNLWETKQEKQRRCAKEHNTTARKTLILLEQKELMTDINSPTGCLFITPAAADLIKKELGLELQALAARANAVDMLYRPKSSVEQNTMQMTKKGIGRCYCFDLSETINDFDYDDSIPY